MTTAAASLGKGETIRWRLRPPRSLIVALVMTLLLYGGSLVVRLAVPEPTGPHAVGRARIVWIDESRPEIHTAAPSDMRAVPVQLWYPAQPGTGEPAPYVDDLDVIGAGLRSSGELSWIELLGLRLVRDGTRRGATVAEADAGYPLLVLSPGNATNVGFYSALAEDLASRGYVVLGVDHPFQVAAVAIGDGSVAVYDHSQDLSLGSIEQKIEERVADIEFVLDRIRAGDEEVGFLTASLDLDRIGVLGHSNGGLTALETCRADAEVLACLNIDGQGAGGPFGHERGATAPEQPFMYLTKETSIHPELNRRFETAGQEAVRAVIPGAAHSDFTDGGLFEPGLDPLGGRVRDVAVSVRSLAGAFFDQWLKEPRTRPYSGLVIPSDVYINVYPLGGSPPIPVAAD